MSVAMTHMSVAAGMSHTRKQEADPQSVGPKCMSIRDLFY